jgi:hypothetical protein
MNPTIFPIAKELPKGTRVRISRTFNTGKTEEYEAIVNWAEDRGAGLIYFGYVPVKAGTLDWDPIRGMWGTERMMPVEARRPFDAVVKILPNFPHLKKEEL